VHRLEGSDGSVVWSSEQYDSAGVSDVRQTGDINGDNVDDVVAVFKDLAVETTTKGKKGGSDDPKTEIIRTFSGADGSLIYEYPVDLENSQSISVLAEEDINNDGMPDIVISDDETGTVKHIIYVPTP